MTEEEELKVEFEEWFTSMLISFATNGCPLDYPLGSCLQRMVIVDAKKELWKSYKKVVGEE